MRADDADKNQPIWAMQSNLGSTLSVMLRYCVKR